MENVATSDTSNLFSLGKEVFEVVHRAGQPDVRLNHQLSEGMWHTVDYGYPISNYDSATEEAEKHLGWRAETGNCAGMVVVARDSGKATHVVTMGANKTVCGLPLAGGHYQRIGKGVRPWYKAATCGRCVPSAQSGRVSHPQTN